MGVLIARHYPTKLFLKAADHTYVECGTGQKGWACWGGKTGGEVLASATGSTNQANDIAGADEKANIKCYLINGVCHQAANRILYPAGITVRDARGYGVSESIYGPYGRPTWIFGQCESPFDKHEGSSGELPSCAQTPSDKQLTMQALIPPAAASKERKYIASVLDVYQKGSSIKPALNAFAASPDAEDFMVELFKLKLSFHFGSRLAKKTLSNLITIRRSVERSRMKIEEWFTNPNVAMDATALVEELNKETLLFQENLSGALSKEQYTALLNIKPDERVVLADPEIVKEAFKI